MTAIEGRVRVLPYDAPGVPPPVPLVDGRRDRSAMCLVNVPIESVPGGTEFAAGDPSVVGFICTQPRHGAEGLHACHLLAESDDSPEALIVWGGE